MGLDDMPLFAMLKSKLGYINQRQKVISENVANADTPGYAPRDLKPFAFDQVLAASGGGSGAGALRLTQPGHLAGRRAQAAGLRSGASPDSEVRLDGNQVVLEEQMMKLTQSRIDYEAAVGLYQQSVSMITTATRLPGK